MTKKSRIAICAIFVILGVACTLTELRYDEDVENRFAEEIEKYHKENNQELIVVLSAFDTD